MRLLYYAKKVMAIQISLFMLVNSSYGFCKSVFEAESFPHLKLVPSHDPSNSLFVSYKYKKRTDSYVIGDISIFNITGAWFEVTREDNINTQAIPYAFLIGSKGNYPLSEKVFKDVHIEKGQYLQLNAKRTTTAVYLALALDLIGRGLFGVTMPENILDGTHPLITELFTTIKSNHAGELGAFGYAITTRDYNSAIKHLAKFITSTQKSKEVILKLIQEIFGPENSVRYASLMSKNLTDIVFAFKPVKLLTELTYWTFKAPTEGYARLEVIGKKMEDKIGKKQPKETAASVTDQSPVFFEGIGPIRVGMTVSEASQAIGKPLVIASNRGESEGCYYVEPRGGPKGVSFMVINGHIARVDIFDGKFTTERGARIGDSEERIKSLYKWQVEVTGHKYDEHGHYLIISRGTDKYRIVFETDGKRVTNFRAGKLPEVKYVEGCL